MFSTGKLPGSGRLQRNGTVDESPSMDDLYDAFANRRRRYALHYLKQVDGQADFGELSEQIAAWECGKPRREVTSNERKYAYSALQQRHLPKLHDLGLVEFDKREGTVEPAPALNDIDVYAEVVETDNVPWGVYFPTLSGVHALLLSLVAVDTSPLTAFSDFGWALLFVSSFFISSLVFLYDTRQMKLGGANVPPEVKQS